MTRGKPAVLHTAEFDQAYCSPHWWKSTGMCSAICDDGLRKLWAYPKTCQRIWIEFSDGPLTKESIKLDLPCCTHGVRECSFDGKRNLAVIVTSTIRAEIMSVVGWPSDGAWRSVYLTLYYEEAVN